MLELSSTDAWIESLINEEKKGKATENVAQEPSDYGLDSFEEYKRYIKQPRLSRDECPNPISLWGVSTGKF